MARVNVPRAMAKERENGMVGWRGYCAGGGVVVEGAGNSTRAETT